MEIETNIYDIRFEFHPELGCWYLKINGTSHSYSNPYKGKITFATIFDAFEECTRIGLLPKDFDIDRLIENQKVTISV